MNVDMPDVKVYMEGDLQKIAWHLPVIKSEFSAFVNLCKKRRIDQSPFIRVFQEDGTIVHGQYAFGKKSLQIYSPVVKVKSEEKSNIDLSVNEPKIFWINTNKGYFWVEVRFKDGKASVILTQFTAYTITGEGEVEWVFDGITLASPGMIANCFKDDKKLRYVVAQNGGIIGVNDSNVGQIISESVADNGSRLTPSLGEHEYVVIQNKAKTAEVRKISITEYDGKLSVDRKLYSFDMEYEGQYSVSLQNLLPNPCWIHRKCTGSYVSPNKTIGYHVDTGSDDDFFGNATMFGSGYQNKLDNDGGVGEFLFNHSVDLYRIMPFMCVPISVDENFIELAVCCPTMIYYNDVENSKKYWGGYGVTIDFCGCADYRNDFDTWVLAPRVVKCKLDLNSGEKTYYDFMLDKGAYEVKIDIVSWDAAFKAAVFMEQLYSSDNIFYDAENLETVSSCAWTSDVYAYCGSGLDTVGYSGTTANRWDINQHWSYYTRENLVNERSISFVLGGDKPSYHKPDKINGFYFLFDAKWHLDIGVHWSDSAIVGNACGIISIPLTGQDPGGIVYFRLCGGDEEWIAKNGHESVSNLEIIAPLGYHPMPDALGDFHSSLGFIAKVPETYAAPHEPVVLSGRIEYQSKDIEGKTIDCEHKLMSTPCECSDSITFAPPNNVVSRNGKYKLTVSGGCPPYDWIGSSGVKFVDYDTEKEVPKDELELMTTVTVISDNDCFAKVTVVDVCGKSASLSDTFVPPVGVVTGLAILAPGAEAFYAHNLGQEATYSGVFELVELSINGAILRAPNILTGLEGEITFTTSVCGANSASMHVAVGEYCPYPTSGEGHGYPGMLVSSADRTKCAITVGEFRRSIICLSYGQCTTDPSDNWYMTSFSGLSSVVGELSGNNFCPVHNSLYAAYVDSCTTVGDNTWLFLGDICECGWQAKTIWVKS